MCFRMLRGNPYLFAVMDNFSRYIPSHMASPVKFGAKSPEMLQEAVRGGSSQSLYHGRSA